MVTKKPWGLLGVAGSLVLGAALCHADGPTSKSKAQTGKVRPATYRTEEAPAPPAREATLELGTAKPCPTDVAPLSGPVACSPRPSHNLWCRIWQWVTYRPVTHIGPCHGTTTCAPPPYAYFLEYCPPAPSAHKPGHASPVHVAGRGTSKTGKEEVVEKESFSLMPSFLRPAERRTEKPAETRKTKTDEVLPASRTVTVEGPRVEEPVLRSGKDSSTWRGVHTTGGRR